MNLNNPPSDELKNLIDAALDGQLDEAQRNRLEQILTTDPEECWAYVEYMSMLAGIQYLTDVSSLSSTFKQSRSQTAIEPDGATQRPAAESDSPATPAVPAPILSASADEIDPLRALTGESPLTEHCSSLHCSTLWGRFAATIARPFPAALGASLLTLMAVLAAWNVQRFSSNGNLAPNRPLRGFLAETPVAYLASAVGNSWGMDTPNLNMLGSPVQLGEQLNLQEGIAEFRLSSGVFLSIEGPASLVLLSPTSLILRYGRLTSNIPESVPDFKVMAGACKLTASGAEFGVYLAGGKTDIHAFAGQVAVLNTALVNEELSGEPDAAQIGAQESTATGGSLVDAVVEAGRSLLLSDDGDVVSISGWGTADETKFATRLPMAEPLPISRSYVAAVMASKPAGYWRFESIKGRVAKSDVPEIGDLQVVGEVGLVSGPGNRSIELGGAETSYLKSADLTSVISQSDYSVEVWLRPSHIHAAAMIAMVGTSQITQDERPGFYLGLQGPRGDALHTQESRVTRPGLVRFLNRNPPSADTRIGSSCFSGSSYQVRRWQHVVAAKEGPEMRLYINGKLAATATEQPSLPADLRLIVGESATLRRTFPFHGQLDELAIYRRALTEDEVRRHFKAVDWSADRRREILKEAI